MLQFKIEWKEKNYNGGGRKMQKLVERLIKEGKTISTMESCTGGGVVNSITNIEGASEILRFSAVTYSNEYKMKMGVSPTIIAEYSVYSMETAHEMSKNISEFSKSDYGIGITGKLNRIDPNNPFGDNNMVFVSVYDKNQEEFFDLELEASSNTRKENKELIIKEIEKLVLQVLDKHKISQYQRK